MVLAGLCLAALAGLAVLTAYDRTISLTFLGAIAFSFVVLRGVAILVAFAARRAPPVRSPALRLAIGNLRTRESHVARAWYEADLW